VITFTRVYIPKNDKSLAKTKHHDPNGGPNPIPYGFCGSTGIGIGIMTGDDDAAIAD
jgi:hypothetical protein